MATRSSILAWKIPWTEQPGGYSHWGHKESDTTERLSTHTSFHRKIYTDNYKAHSTSKDQNKVTDKNHTQHAKQ